MEGGDVASHARLIEESRNAFSQLVFGGRLCGWVASVRLNRFGPAIRRWWRRFWRWRRWLRRRWRRFWWRRWSGRATRHQQQSAEQPAVAQRVAHDHGPSRPGHLWHTHAWLAQPAAVSHDDGPQPGRGRCCHSVRQQRLVLTNSPRHSAGQRHANRWRPDGIQQFAATTATCRPAQSTNHSSLERHTAHKETDRARRI